MGILLTAIWQYNQVKGRVAMKGLNTITMFYRYPRIWTPKEIDHTYSAEWIKTERKLSNLISQDSAFITTLLECILRNHKIFPCTRLNIFCTDTTEAFNDDLEGRSREFVLYGSICEMQIEIDMEYPTFNEEKKIEYLFNTLERAFDKFCKRYSVDYEPVKEALAKVYDMVKQRKMLGPYKIGSYKNIRQNGIGAQLISYHSIKAYHFFVVLSSPVIGKVEIPFFETLPGGIHTISPLGKFYWKDDQTLCLEPLGKDNPYSSKENIEPDQLLDVTKYRLAHNLGKTK